MLNVYIVVMGDGNLKVKITKAFSQDGENVGSCEVKFNRGGFLAKRVITAFFQHEEKQ